jgi:hypothetical protein
VFTVDTSAPISVPLNQPLLDCVGSGHSVLALRADYQEHLTRVQRDIGFAHIRGHGLFDDDMSSFLDGGANLYNVFRMLDFYASVKIRPILECESTPLRAAFNVRHSACAGCTSESSQTMRETDAVSPPPHAQCRSCLRRSLLTRVRQSCITGVVRLRPKTPPSGLR